jgi:hypothetical protein
MLFTSHILEILSCIATTAVSFMEYTRHKRRELLCIPLGLGLFCLLTVIEIIVFSLPATFQRRPFSHRPDGVHPMRRFYHRPAQLRRAFNSKSYKNLTGLFPRHLPPSKALTPAAFSPPTIFITECSAMPPVRRNVSLPDV